jgi:RimJ/RimL family protein N-acetyltransferase
MDHAAFIQQLLNTAGWLQFIGDRNVRSEAEAYAYINKINENPAVTYWTVTLSAEPATIGVISLIQRDYLEYPDIGFAFLPEFNGQGYAFEAASAVLDHLRAESNYPQLYAAALPDNTASIKLLIKLGFHFERSANFEHREKLLYSIDIA